MLGRGCARLVVILLALAGCGQSGPAQVSMDAGRGAMRARAPREALAHFRAAVAAAPDLAEAHLERGHAAEALGELDEALEAYSTAARLAPAHRLAFGSLAERMGNAELALEVLEGAEGPWWRNAMLGGLVGGATLAACVAQSWPQMGALWHTCLPAARAQGRTAYQASRDGVDAYRLQILVETGQRERALALARSRGWLQDGVDPCEAGGPVSRETAALLAMLVEPERADCALGIGAAIADDGLVRLGRLILRDRVERSTRREVRARAAWLLRYRLPAHDPAKLAETLNVIGWRLQHQLGNHAEALRVFQKAIASDPAFSWPHHNIGRVYMDLKDYEQAHAWLRRAVEINPNHWRAQFNLGVASHRLRRYDEALQAYSRAAAMDPDDAGTRANLGWVLLTLGRRPEAIRELQTAVRLDPRLEAERRYLATASAPAR